MRWVAVAVLALAVAGCGGSGVHVIGWTGQRGPVAPAPALARPCRASDVKLGSLTGDWNGAGGDLVGSVWATNISRSTCSLVGRPSVGFAGVKTRNRSIASFDRNALNGRPLSSLRSLDPGQSAVLDLIWNQSWCGTPPKGLFVTLRGGSTLRVPNHTAPHCDEMPAKQSSAALVSVAPWVPAPISDPPAVPLRVTLLGPTQPQRKYREVVYHVRRATVLRYEVALTNTSSRPFAFKRCPFFTVTAGRTAAYVLNCRAIGTLPPGQRAVFAMQMHVNGPIGGFLWQLDTANAPGDHAEVVVTG